MTTPTQLSCCRMSAKASGSFTIATSTTDIGSRYCRKLQQADGYGYCFQRKERRNFSKITADGVAPLITHVLRQIQDCNSWTE